MLAHILQLLSLSETSLNGNGTGWHSIKAQQEAGRAAAGVSFMYFTPIKPGHWRAAPLPRACTRSVPVPAALGSALSSQGALPFNAPYSLPKFCFLFLLAVSPTGTPTRGSCDFHFPKMHLGIPSLWVWA